MHVVLNFLISVEQKIWNFTHAKNWKGAKKDHFQFHTAKDTGGSTFYFYTRKRNFYNFAQFSWVCILRISEEVEIHWSRKQLENLSFHLNSEGSMEIQVDKK